MVHQEAENQSKTTYKNITGTTLIRRSRLIRSWEAEDCHVSQTGTRKIYFLSPSWEQGSVGRSAADGHVTAWNLGAASTTNTRHWISCQEQNLHLKSQDTSTKVNHLCENAKFEKNTKISCGSHSPTWFKCFQRNKSFKNGSDFLILMTFRCILPHRVS